MAVEKLPRLAINWSEQPEMLRRYWDKAMFVIDSLSLPILVADLPSNPGAFRRMVSDANSTTFNSIVAGGGSNTVPVFFDGTNWRIG